MPKITSFGGKKISFLSILRRYSRAEGGVTKPLFRVMEFVLRVMRKLPRKNEAFYKNASEVD